MVACIFGVGLKDGITAGLCISTCSRVISGLKFFGAVSSTALCFVCWGWRCSSGKAGAVLTRIGAVPGAGIDCGSRTSSAKRTNSSTLEITVPSMDHSRVRFTERMPITANFLPLQARHYPTPQVYTHPAPLPLYRYYSPCPLK